MNLGIESETQKFKRTTSEIKKTEDKITDIDDDSVQRFINSAIESKWLPNDKSDNISIVKKLGLTSEDCLNNAGRVLFSKNKPIAVKNGSVCN